LPVVEETLRTYLSRLDFKVKSPYVIDKFFDVDVLAARGGLTVIIDVSIGDQLNLDSVAKIEAIGLYLKEKYKVVSIKKVLVTTSKDISSEIEDFAKKKEILLLKTTAEPNEIVALLNRINFLKPIPRTNVSVLKIVEDEIKGKGEKRCLDLLSKVRKWYQEGGKSLVTKSLEKEADQVSKVEEE
jgi:hypothetical protein